MLLQLLAKINSDAEIVGKTGIQITKEAEDFTARSKSADSKYTTLLVMPTYQAAFEELVATANDLVDQSIALETLAATLTKTEKSFIESQKEFDKLKPEKFLEIKEHKGDIQLAKRYHEVTKERIKTEFECIEVLNKTLAVLKPKVEELSETCVKRIVEIEALQEKEAARKKLQDEQAAAAAKAAAAKAAVAKSATTISSSQTNYQHASGIPAHQPRSISVR